MSVWFTSDLHIGHPKIAELRGFSTVKEEEYHTKDVMKDFKRTEELLDA